ncbi:hypothetical protein K439DRAFT_531523 [Ramaria rubella]|nr:hypothetical protein K439DRAFT_531523 [Ramaria rubella]
MICRNNERCNSITISWSRSIQVAQKVRGPRYCDISRPAILNLFKHFATRLVYEFWFLRHMIPNNKQYILLTQGLSRSHVAQSLQGTYCELRNKEAASLLLLFTECPLPHTYTQTISSR